MAELIPTVRVQAEPFDIQDEIDALSAGRTDVGAVVSFTGLCRDEGGRLSALELEHYPAMTEKSLGQIANTACDRWDLLGLTIIHRVGRLELGQQIVLVVTCADHRKEALDACSYVMDRLKTDAPFWKKQWFKDGRVEWVEERQTDLDASKEWHS